MEQSPASGTSQSNAADNPIDVFRARLLSILDDAAGRKGITVGKLVGNFDRTLRDWRAGGGIVEQQLWRLIRQIDDVVTESEKADLRQLYPAYAKAWALQDARIARNRFPTESRPKAARERLILRIEQNGITADQLRDPNCYPAIMDKLLISPRQSGGQIREVWTAGNDLLLTLQKYPHFFGPVTEQVNFSIIALVAEELGWAGMVCRDHSVVTHAARVLWSIPNYVVDQRIALNRQHVLFWKDTVLGGQPDIHRANIDAAMKMKSSALPMTEWEKSVHTLIGILHSDLSSEKRLGRKTLGRVEEKLEILFHAGRFENLATICRSFGEEFAKNNHFDEAQSVVQYGLSVLNAQQAPCRFIQAHLLETVRSLDQEQRAPFRFR